jgi:hypothetical protein
MALSQRGVTSVAGRSAEDVELSLSELRQRLDRAGALVVLWSMAAARSKFVPDELAQTK